MVKAFLHPRPGYVPKVPDNVVRPIVLQALCPPPFQNADQERHNLLCPVRALDVYDLRAALWRKNEQLFICFGPPNKNSPASKLRMSKWVVEAISLAYESASQPSLMAVRPHSTRNMAAFKALISGVAFQEVCDVAGRSSPQVPRCFRPSAALLISHRTGTRRYGDVVLTLPKAFLTQRSSLEREHSVTTVTSVPWRGNERCIPGHISFLPVSDLLRLFKLVTASFGQAL